MATDRLSGVTYGLPREADWLAPAAAGPVHSLVHLPGSKSMTNRALVLAALADGPSLIENPLVARDTRLMADALRALGCVIEESPGRWRTEPMRRGEPRQEDRAGSGSHGRPDDHRRQRITIDVGNAGTVLRFVPALAALTAADVTFVGDERAARRPVGALLDALRQLGAEIDDGGTGSVPFVLSGHGGLAGGEALIDASSSSQLISGLLLAAPRFDTGVLIRHSGLPVPSAPHIEMTVAMLRARGVDVRTGGAADIWQVLPGRVLGGSVTVEPDLSNALPFLAAPLAAGGEVTVADWPSDSLQPAERIIALLTSMGGEVRRTPQGLRVRGSGRIRGIDADLGEVGELTPVLTALAALAGSPSQFTGIGHLRGHETDRLAALATEIGKLGGEVTELADGLRITPGRLRARGVVFDSHDDHRLVMAAAVLGLATDGLCVHNAATVGKTFPGFGQAWARLLAPAG